MSEILAQDKILELLKNRGELNILDLSSALKMNRHTIAKYLEVLKSKGLIDFSTKGKSKLWRLTDNNIAHLLGANEFISNQMLSILTDLDYDVSIQSKDYDMIWHSIKNEKGKCYEVLKGKKVPCTNCPSKKVFKTGLPQKVATNQKGVKKIKLYNPIKNESGDVIAVVEITKNQVAKVD